MAHEHHYDDEQYITLINENGDEELFEILFTFESDEFEKSYVLCYPVGEAEDDEEVVVHAYSYIPTEEGEIGELSPVTTDEEWDIIEEVYNTFIQDEEEEE
ncbi:MULTISPECIES: DUF1292 domain-containing protein [Neobacillus]|jgi:uncharacterized protein YrzB (UPF0473 family)|uniref:UPF0473 protein KHA99_24340 n=2 Tax=Neobacillus TaxID=2675232 RepID=A0A942UAB2_9BACI|nr:MULTISPECIES: DUF1292 domain-containing protein [Neobacillus]MBS4215552.1 DUF1292 domain-containing protein [Neobacillus rhizophilus]MBU8916552.1 DUF1292 domain-containing protein [Bacillus sp. FJAT-29953]MCH6266452.1 DUF1292 domain-containing protein [Neobacillus citreus]